MTFVVDTILILARTKLNDYFISMILLIRFLDLSSRVRDREGREFAETRGLDSGEVLGRRELPTVAILRAERRRMLDEIFGTACRGQTRLRRRGHMRQSVLQSNPHGERRGKNMSRKA